MVPFELNYTVDSVQGILNYAMDVEMLVNFDEWQRNGLDDEYEVQDQWPLVLRRARVMTAVDYFQVLSYKLVQIRGILNILSCGSNLYINYIQLSGHCE